LRDWARRAFVVLIHGIPGFWYDWRNQIPALARHFQVVPIDQRGFNLSDQAEGVENYKLNKLLGDIAFFAKASRPVGAFGEATGLYPGLIALGYRTSTRLGLRNSFPACVPNHGSSLFAIRGT